MKNSINQRIYKNLKAIRKDVEFLLWDQLLVEAIVSEMPDV